MLKELRLWIEMQITVKKQLETKKRSQSKLDNSIAEIKTELNAIKTRLNNAEK